MPNIPDWLPRIISVSPWTEEHFDNLYSFFCEDFKDSQPTYKGQSVWTFPQKSEEKEDIFWHLTSQTDQETHNRLPDLRRCERLRWVRSIIENSDEPEVKEWNYEEGDGSTKTYLWLEEGDFLVILKKYPNGKYRLVTAFYIDYSHMKKKLQKKYEKRIQ